MKITSESNRLQTVKENQTYTIQYGALRKGADTKVEIFLEGAAHLSYTKSCQCTAPNIEVLENGIKLTISYDNKKVGTINQYVEETVRVEGEQKKIRFNLKGQII